MNGCRNSQDPQAPASGGDGDPSWTKQLDRFLEKKKVKVDFPDHLYIPEYAQPVDLRNVFDVAPGTGVGIVPPLTIIDFTCPPGGITRILQYAVYNDGLLAADYDFVPTLSGRRIYPFQGDPLDNFRIYLGVSGDGVSNSSLLYGNLNMKPGERLLWQAINRSAVSTTMGVRVVGYFTEKQTSQQRFGG